jgi:hypothetical protein
MPGQEYGKDIYSIVAIGLSWNLGGNGNGLEDER